MTSSDQDKDVPSSNDRIAKIKAEEKEDPSAYYAQGDSKDGFNEELEFSKPVPSLESAREEMSLTKAVAYLGFGLAALAIVFILFFIRDLDDRVGGVDSAVSSLEEKIAPLRKEVKDNLDKVNADITGLKSKINDSESKLAVMELKRALVAIQSMKLSNNPEVKVKSSELITSIESLIGEFGTNEFNNSIPVEQISAGKVIVEEAPVNIELPFVEPTLEEQAPVVEENLEESITGVVLEPEPESEVEEITEETADDKVEESEEDDEEESEEEGGEDKAEEDE